MSSTDTNHARELELAWKTFEVSKVTLIPPSRVFQSSSMQHDALNRHRVYGYTGYYASFWNRVAAKYLNEFPSPELEAKTLASRAARAFALLQAGYSPASDIEWLASGVGVSSEGLRRIFCDFMNYDGTAGAETLDHVCSPRYRFFHGHKALPHDDEHNPHLVRRRELLKRCREELAEKRNDYDLLAGVLGHLRDACAVDDKLWDIFLSCPTVRDEASAFLVRGKPLSGQAGASLEQLSIPREAQADRVRVWRDVSISHEEFRGQATSSYYVIRQCLTALGEVCESASSRVSADQDPFGRIREAIPDVEWPGLQTSQLRKVIDDIRGNLLPVLEASLPHIEKNCAHMETMTAFARHEMQQKNEAWNRAESEVLAAKNREFHEWQSVLNGARELYETAKRGSPEDIKKAAFRLSFYNRKFIIGALSELAARDEDGNAPCLEELIRMIPEEMEVPEGVETSWPALPDNLYSAKGEWEKIAARIDPATAAAVLEKLQGSQSEWFEKPSRFPVCLKVLDARLTFLEAAAGGTIRETGADRLSEILTAPLPEFAAYIGSCMDYGERKPDVPETPKVRRFVLNSIMNTAEFDPAFVNQELNLALTGGRGAGFFSRYRRALQSALGHEIPVDTLMNFLSDNYGSAISADELDRPLGREDIGLLMCAPGPGGAPPLFERIFERQWRKRDDEVLSLMGNLRHPGMVIVAHSNPEYAEFLKSAGEPIGAYRKLYPRETPAEQRARWNVKKGLSLERMSSDETRALVDHLAAVCPLKPTAARIVSFPHLSTSNLPGDVEADKYITAILGWSYGPHVEYFFRFHTTSGFGPNMPPSGTVERRIKLGNHMWEDYLVDRECISFLLDSRLKENLHTDVSGNIWMDKEFRQQVVKSPRRFQKGGELVLLDKTHFYAWWDLE